MNNDMQQQVASHLINAIGTQYSMSASVFSHGAEKVTLASSVALVGIAALCNELVDIDKKPTVTNDRGGKTAVPSSDDVIFACLYVAYSGTFDNTGGLRVEFSHDNIIKSLDQFREMMGRPYDDNLDKNLLEEVNKTRIKALEGLNDNNSKFLPH